MTWQGAIIKQLSMTGRFLCLVSTATPDCKLIAVWLSSHFWRLKPTKQLILELSVCTASRRGQKGTAGGRLAGKSIQLSLSSPHLSFTVPMIPKAPLFKLGRLSFQRKRWWLLFATWGRPCKCASYLVCKDLNVCKWSQSTCVTSREHEGIWKNLGLLGWTFKWWQAGQLL